MHPRPQPNEHKLTEAELNILREAAKKWAPYFNIQEKTLNLSGGFLSIAKITSQDIPALILFINTYQIKKVDLSNNHLDADDIERIAQGNRSATDLDLSGNDFGPEGAERFALANQTATRVDLSFNRLGREGAVRFIVANKIATDVNLAVNRLGPQGALEVVRANKTATAIGFDMNSINNAAILQMIPLIKHGPLKELDLTDNEEISADILTAVYNVVGQNNQCYPALAQFFLTLALFRSNTPHRFRDSLIQAPLNTICEMIGIPPAFKQAYLGLHFFNNVASERLSLDDLLPNIKHAKKEIKKRMNASPSKAELQAMTRQMQLLLHLEQEAQCQKPDFQKAFGDSLVQLKLNAEDLFPEVGKLRTYIFSMSRNAIRR